MEKLPVDKVYALSEILTNTIRGFADLTKGGKDFPMPHEGRETVTAGLKNLLKDPNVLGAFPFTNLLLVDFLKRLQNPNEKITAKEIHGLMGKMSERIKHELALQSFYKVPQNMVKYYTDAKAIFGSKVALAFPSSLDDIDEAGKCLAVGRSTACVFHLMRALEPVLKAIYTELAIVKHSPTWHAYLSAFDKAISAKFSSKTKIDKENAAFYADVKAHFYTVKDGWRNPTMHNVAAIYTEEQAEGVFNAVKSLLQKISEKVKESPAP
jgi:hypothetical protein